MTQTNRNKFICIILLPILILMLCSFTYEPKQEINNFSPIDNTYSQSGLNVVISDNGSNIEIYGNMNSNGTNIDIPINYLVKLNSSTYYSRFNAKSTDLDSEVAISNNFAIQAVFTDNSTQTLINGSQNYSNNVMNGQTIERFRFVFYSSIGSSYVHWLITYSFNTYNYTDFVYNGYYSAYENYNKGYLDGAFNSAVETTKANNIVYTLANNIVYNSAYNGLEYTFNKDLPNNYYMSGSLYNSNNNYSPTLYFDFISINANTTNLLLYYLGLFEYTLYDDSGGYLKYNVYIPFAVPYKVANQDNTYLKDNIPLIYTSNNVSLEMLNSIVFNSAMISNNYILIVNDYTDIEQQYYNFNVFSNINNSNLVQQATFKQAYFITFEPYITDAYNSIRNFNNRLCLLNNNEYIFNYGISSDIYNNIYDSAYNSGYAQGSIASNEKEYQAGYNKGYQEGASSNNTFYSLITAIVDTPTKFIYNFLSFEILGVNVANVFIGFISILVIIWLVKKLL